MKDERPLLALTLGTFHTVLLTLVVVLLLFLTLDLGEALGELNTAAGLAVFAALWATSVYCAHRGLRDSGLDVGKGTTVRVLATGSAWGGWNGVLFFWCLLFSGLLILLGTAAADRGDAIAGTLVFGVVGFGVGTIAAYAIGAFLGVVVALVHLQLLRAARVLAGSRPKPSEA